MRIGILSDSHGKGRTLRKALTALSRRGAEAIVHCGDLGSVECIEMLGEACVPSYVVAGNMDRHTDRLADAAQRCGVAFHWEAIEVPLGDGQFLVATHGHDERILSEMIRGEQFPYVCHGHTHRVRDDRFGPVRVICPGALCHPRHPRYPTAALLDTERDQLDLFPVR